MILDTYLHMVLSCRVSNQNGILEYDLGLWATIDLGLKNERILFFFYLHPSIETFRQKYHQKEKKWFETPSDNHKKYNLTLAMSPTCHCNNTSFAHNNSFADMNFSQSVVSKKYFLRYELLRGYFIFMLEQVVKIPYIKIQFLECSVLQTTDNRHKAMHKSRPQDLHRWAENYPTSPCSQLQNFGSFHDTSSEYAVIISMLS